MGASSPALFRTVATHDYLQFWQAGRFHPQRVVKFLKLSKEEIAQLAGISVASVRFDRKAPHQLLDQLHEVAATCSLVAQFFEGNAIKTALWFATANPTLGNASPCEMIRSGKHDDLRRFVLEALSGIPSIPS